MRLLKAMGLGFALLLATIAVPTAIFILGTYSLIAMLAVMILILFAFAVFLVHPFVD